MLKSQQVVPLTQSREKLFVCEGSIGKPHREVRLTYAEALRGCPRRGCEAVIVSKDSGPSK